MRKNVALDVALAMASVCLLAVSARACDGVARIVSGCGNCNQTVVAHVVSPVQTAQIVALPVQQVHAIQHVQAVRVAAVQQVYAAQVVQQVRVKRAPVVQRVVVPRKQKLVQKTISR